MSAPSSSIRLDKWLYFARFFKTRTLSAKTVTGGHVRVNSEKVLKAAALVGVGDTLTFAQGNHIRVVRILDIGKRRGPAPEACELYDDLSPIEKQDTPAPLAPRSGRPTKQDRRRIIQLKESAND